MSEFFEFDPLTGIRTDMAYDPNTHEVTLTRSSDVQPVLDFAGSVRNEVGLNRKDIQESWWMYAKLPPIVILQMRAKGINVFDKNDEKRMFAEINSHYPHLKTTTGNHGGKVRITASG